MSIVALTVLILTVGMVIVIGVYLYRDGRPGKTRYERLRSKKNGPR